MNLLSTIGITASLLGVGANLLSDYVSEKKTEEMIDKKIEEKLAAREQKEES